MVGGGLQVLREADGWLRWGRGSMNVNDLGKELFAEKAVINWMLGLRKAERKISHYKWNRTKTESKRLMLDLLLISQ